MHQDVADMIQLKRLWLTITGSQANITISCMEAMWNINFELLYMIDK